MGLPMTAALDSDSLSEQDERDLRDMLETAGFFQLPDAISSSGPRGDRFLYRLTVDVEEDTVEMSDSAVPSELRPLVERLTMASRRARGSSRPP
jgi:hypothetical protein